jgi:hypothetical protein
MLDKRIDSDYYRIESDFLHILSVERTQPQRGLKYDVAMLRRSAHSR